MISESIQLFHTIASVLAVIAIILAIFIFKKHSDLFYSERYFSTQKYVSLAIVSIHLAFIAEIYLGNLVAYIILEVIASILLIYAFLSTILREF